MLKTPILFLIFNRPDLTKIVFEKIRENKPNRLYIAADGPRANKSQEKYLCEESRKIIEKVDWDCEVKTLFRENNLGLKKAVTEALDWFFDNEEKGIILEDDCLADNSFFTFCENLLEYYKDDKRIMHISGDNFQDGIKRGDGSYYFSKIMHCWGWASWRRAWEFNDKNLTTYKYFMENNLIRNIFSDIPVQNYWTRSLKRSYSGELNSWALVWAYSILLQNGLCIMPNKNLVSNIGFGIDSTHTKCTASKLANIKLNEISQITHPKLLIPDYKADNYTFINYLNVK